MLLFGRSELDLLAFVLRMNRVRGRYGSRRGLFGADKRRERANLQAVKAARYVLVFDVAKLLPSTSIGSKNQQYCQLNGPDK